MTYTYTFTFLSVLMVAAACNGPVKKDLPKEKEHPKLIKTIGDPKYGNVQCILQDKAGNLWFGTSENGLYKYDGKSFTRFLMADGLNSDNIYCLLEDTNGKIWIGTMAGLCIHDPSAPTGINGKIFTEIKIPLPKNLPPNKNPYYRNAHWVYSIMQAKSGKLWFVTIDGVYIYDAKSLPAGQTDFTLFEIKEAANGFLASNDKVERILEDIAGNIWFGGRTNAGVYRYDGKSITNFKLPELFQNGPTPKPHNWAWPQWQDKNGNIWFSNWGGAYRYNPSASQKTDSGSFTAFTKKDGLPGMVTRIIEDKKGNLWLGGDGICRYDPSASLRTGSQSFTCFTAKDGLNTSGVWSILEDKTGNIWVGTRETGLFLYDVHLPDGQGKRFIPYSEYEQQPAANQQ